MDIAMMFALVSKRARAERALELLTPVWAQLQPVWEKLQPDLPELKGIALEFAAVLAPGLQARLAGVAPLAAYDVSWLQTSLNTLAAEKLNVDGDYGDAVRAAVKRYQLARGLFVDGWAGPDTITSIIVDLHTAKVAAAPTVATKDKK